MWSTTASTVSTVAVSNDEYLVNTSTEKKVCISKYYHHSAKLDEYWYRRIIANPFDSILEQHDKSKLSCGCEQVTDLQSQQLPTFHQSDICETLELQALNRKVKDVKITTWRKSPCYKTTCFLSGYYNHPKLVLEIPGYSEIKVDDILSLVIDKGYNTFFLNISYGTHKHHNNIIDEIKKARAISKYPIGLGMIISSHQLITGMIQNNDKNVYLDLNLKLILTTNRKYGHLCSHEVIYGNFIDFINRIGMYDRIKIGDHIIVEVLEIHKDCLRVEVIKDGLLYSNMVIMLPNSGNEKPVHLKTEEKIDIDEAFGYGCDHLIFPCPLNVCILNYMKTIQIIHNQKPIVFGKVELNKVELFKEEIDYLAKIYDGLWLADCTSHEGEPLLDYIFNLLIENRKHILCTSKLSQNDVTLKGLSGHQNNYNYIAKIDGLVVSNALNTNYRNLIQKAYSRMNEKVVWNYKAFMNTKIDCGDIHCEYIRKTVLLTFKYKASCIIIINESGKSVLKLAKARPLIPILAAFKNNSTAQQLTICRNVYCTITNCTSLYWSQYISEQLNTLMVIGKSLGFIQDKTQFVFCFQTEIKLEECDAIQVLIEDEMI